MKKTIRFAVIPKGEHPWFDKVHKGAQAQAEILSRELDVNRHAIKEGLMDSSSASIPKMQGSMSILMLWQASPGFYTPPIIDTGVVLITQDNIDRYLADAE